MSKYNSIQEYNAFISTIVDTVNDYLRYSTVIDETDGIYVDGDDEVSLVSNTDIQDKNNFYPILGLLTADDAPEVDIDKVQDIADKYIFVR